MKELDNIKIPILIIDKKWLRIFDKHRRSPEMSQICDDITELMKKSAHLSIVLKSIEKNKKDVSLSLMTLSQNMVDRLKHAESEYEYAQSQIMKLENKISQTEDSIADIELQIEKKNRKLFKLSAKAAYNAVCLQKMQKNKFIYKIKTFFLFNIMGAQEPAIDYKSAVNFINDYMGYDGLEYLEKLYKGRFIL